MNMGDSVVLVTGGAGYIGSVLCRKLLAAGYRVRVYDSLLFGGEGIMDLSNNSAFSLMKGDIRDEGGVKQAMKGVGSVVHLAAMVGDPACDASPDEAREVNETGSGIVLAEAAIAGVRRFLFASTCSNYGMNKESGILVNEFSALDPQSHYASLKVAFEKRLMNGDFPDSWTILRFATVYGLSPRTRFDLTINQFTRDLTLGLPLTVYGENTWRPYCHVSDLAASVVSVLKEDEVRMKGKIYNVGDSSENYTKRQIVSAIQKQVPEGIIEYQAFAGTDKRDYRVDFSRIFQELGFRIGKRIHDGISEIRVALQNGMFADPFAERYRNC